MYQGHSRIDPDLDPSMIKAIIDKTQAILRLT
jgi:hypothetical protein